MNYPVFVGNLEKPVAVRALELRRLTVFKNTVDYRVIRTELFEDLGVRTVTHLRLFENRELQLVEKHLSKLLGRIDVELATSLKIYALRVLLTADCELVRIRLKSVAVDLEADALHIGKHA